MRKRSDFKEFKYLTVSSLPHVMKEPGGRTLDGNRYQYYVMMIVIKRMTKLVMMTMQAMKMMKISLTAFLPSPKEAG